MLGSFILNSYANSDKIDTMMAYNDAEVEGFQNYTQPALYKISWTLTTQASTIVDLFLTGEPKSLIYMADTANPHLPTWANK